MAFWVGWGYVLVAGLSLLISPLGDLYDYRWYRVPGYLLLSGVIVVWYRLWQAYRLIMRFDHAGASILASQVIVFLAMFSGLVVFAVI